MIRKIDGSLNYSPTLAPRNTAKQQSFTGAATPKPREFTSYLKQEKLVKFLQKLKWFDGEQGRILITAIGTGAIAPLFIAWNPYVKPKEGATQEEKDNLKRTQKYTAMRQPISAALAIPIQMSLVKPINNGLDILFNNKNYAKVLPTYLDKSALQDDGYIKRQEKKKLKGQNLSKEDRKAKLEANVKKVKEEQIKSVAEGLLENGQIRIRDGEKGLVDNKSVVEALKIRIKEYAADANFLRHDSFSDKNLEDLFNNPEIKLVSPEEGRRFYADRAETLVNNETSLRENLLTNLPKEDKDITNYLKEKMNSITDNEKLKKVYQEIIDLSDPKAQRSRCQRTIERIDKVKDACNGNFTKLGYLKYMTKIDQIVEERLRKFAQLAKDLKENPESIKETIGKVAKICTFNNGDAKENKIFKGISSFHIDPEKLKTKISQDIVKTYKEMMGKRYRFIKEVAGISLGLFITVPVTCHALNWVYPRFMDIFFPNLAKKGNTSVNKNGGDK